MKRYQFAVILENQVYATFYRKPKAEIYLKSLRKKGKTDCFLAELKNGIYEKIACSDIP